MKAGDELKALTRRAHDDGDEHALQCDRSRQRPYVLGIELAHVDRNVDLLYGDRPLSDCTCGW